MGETTRENVEEIPKAEDCYDENGVDLSLIRWMLSMTPIERLHVLQQTVTTIVKLRNANSEL